MKFIGVIPARGGSKRVHRKNIREVNGMPLVYWTIKYATQSKLLNKFVVSTEDKEIKDIVNSYGVEVLDRPKELSTDSSKDWGYLKHTLDNYPSENVVLLRPTTPIRHNNIIDKCIKEYERQNVESFVTVSKESEYEAFSDLEKEIWYHNNGVVEIHNANVINSGEPYSKDNNYKYVLDEIYKYEIDTELDLKIVEFLMKEIGIV